MMIRNAIIFATALLGPCATMADDSSSISFADKHWEVILERCPLQASQYAARSENTIYSALQSMSDDLSTTEEHLFQAGSAELSDLDVYYGAFAVSNAAVIAQSLQFMSLFKRDDITMVEVDALDSTLRSEARAGFELVACIWPSESERVEIAESRWADGFDEIVQGYCELHFFALLKRHLDTPIVQLTKEDRQLAGDTVMTDHEKYLEAFKDASQCGEFL